MKGQDMSIKTVGSIVLVLLVVAVVYAAFTGSFNDLVTGFTGGVEYPDPSP